MKESGVLPPEAVAWELYAHQLLFWSNPVLYVPCLKRGELPSTILPPNVILAIKAARLKERGEFMNEELGTLLTPQKGSDLGETNGEYPIKVGVKVRYLTALIAIASIARKPGFILKRNYNNCYRLINVT